jgi:3-hydroxybutyrate dehydrogenase
LVGSFIGIKYAFPIMKAQQFGRVINCGDHCGNFI